MQVRPRSLEGRELSPDELTAGAFVEWGGSELWPTAAGGRPEPDPERAPGIAGLIDIFVAGAERLGLSEREATSIALAWFDVHHWVNLMITVMARREFRDAVGPLPEIGDAAARLGDSVPRAHGLPGLAPARETDLFGTTSRA